MNTKLPIFLASAALTALLATPAQAQEWTGVEVLESGDWIEMSYDGSSGPRLYEPVGDSLRWLAGSAGACWGNSVHANRCIHERTFALPLPETCVGPIEIEYHYTRESNDNDFFVGVGSATEIVNINNGDSPASALQSVSFSNLGDPDFDSTSLLALGGSVMPPIGGELWVSGSFEMSATDWTIESSALSTAYATPVEMSATTSALASPGEPLYVFLLAGDRHEQYVLHSVSVTGCEAVEEHYWNGHYYFYSPSAKTHQQAQQECESRGPSWNLATISSQAENDFVYSLTDAEHPWVWIGLNDVDTEGVFEWASGETLTFTDWAGEPNNLNNEDCARIEGSGWNDAYCWFVDSRTAFVCESEY